MMKVIVTVDVACMISGNRLLVTENVMQGGNSCAFGCGSIWRRACSRTRV
jgi:hypothetical protein